MRITAAVILAAALCVPAAAQWKNYGNALKVSETNLVDEYSVDTSSGSKILIQFGDEFDGVRFRYSKGAAFGEKPEYAIRKSRVKVNDKVIKVTNEREYFAVSAKSQGPSGDNDWISVRIYKKPMRIEVYDSRGALVLREDPADRARFNEETGETRVSFLRRGETETYYGFGEKAFPGMSRHGEYIVNWNTDTFAYPVGLDPIYQSIPFFYALRDGEAYGIFFDNTYRTFFDMGKTSPGRYTFGADGGELDFYLFTGGDNRSPEGVLSSYSALTGVTDLPPLWALGNQQSRYSYYPEARVREIVSKFLDLQIPLDVIYLDIDYMNGYRVFTWDRERFPDPAKLTSDHLSKGIRTVLIIDPGVKVDENYKVYTDGISKGVFVKNPDGSEFIGSVWAGKSVFPDFTDPSARDWFGSQYRDHIEEGIAGFWNDMNEPATFAPSGAPKPGTYHHPDKTFPYVTRHAGDGFPGDHRQYHNVYGMQMARATFEGLRRLSPGKRPFVLTRAGFAGIQRYAAVWTGDNISSWDHLQLSIPMLANLSVSGVPFVGADVGGFFGMPSGELYTRWLQAAALTPFLRSHSVTTAPNKEPWEYGDEFTAINRESIRLRYHLLPYIYTQFEIHSRQGSPVMRPLWFNYPGDQNTYLIADEYLVGNDLLVAPVVKEGERRRRVYFPAGDDWRDLETGELYKGGSWAVVAAPLEKLPLFGRVGAALPVQDPVMNTNEMRNAPVTLLVIAGIEEGRTESIKWYQDEGDGYGYRRGQYLVTQITHERGALKFSRNGGLEKRQQLTSVVALGVASKPSAILADGKALNFQFDAAGRRVSVRVSDDVRLLELKR